MTIITIDSIKKGIKKITPRFEKNLFFLFLSAQVRNIGINLLGTFGVIFFYQKFSSSIYLFLLYFFLGSFPYVLFVPLAGKIVCKIGLKKSIIISSFLFILLDLSYILFSYDLSLAIILSLILTTVSRAFYWIPYHIYFASFTNKKTRGFQISIIKDIVVIINIILPIIASFFINTMGFNILFIFSMIFHLLSVIPIFKIDDIKLNYTFKYFESFKKVFSKEFFHDSVLFFLEGIESTFSVLLWPIAVFAILKGDFAELGILTSAVIFFTIIINIIIGKMSDKKNKESIIKVGSILYSFGWIMKMFSFTGIQIFLSSLYHNISDSIMRISYDSYWYNEDSKRGKYIDEYVVLHELVYHFGRSFCIVIIVMFMKYFNFTISNTFLFGALAYLILGLFVKKDTKLIEKEE